MVQITLVILFQNLSQTTGYINPVAALALQLQQVQQLAAATNTAALTGLNVSPAQGLHLFPHSGGPAGVPVTSSSHQHHQQSQHLAGNGSGHVQNSASGVGNCASPITVAQAGTNQSAVAPNSGPPISLCNGGAAALSAAIAANQQSNMALAAAALVAGTGLNGKLKNTLS